MDNDTGGGAARDGLGNGRGADILLGMASVRVVVVDRDGGLAKRTVEMIGEAGGQAIALEGDVAPASLCASMVAAAVDRFGRLDFLDLPPVIGRRDSVLYVGEDAWRRVMRLNL